MHRRPLLRRPRPPGWARLSDPTSRTVALTVAMGVAGVVLGAYSLRWGRPVAPFPLAWWELAPAVVLANVLSFHLQIRGEAHTFTLSELPLVLGCLFAPPWAVILGRLVGDVLYQIARRRHRGIKLWFNLAVFLLETVVTLVVVHAIDAGRPASDWASWPLVLVAVACADLVSMTAVSCAVRWHGGTMDKTSLVLAGTITAVVNVNLALLVAVVLWNNPDAIVLLLVVVVMTALAYRAYTGLSKRYSSLKLLYDFTKVVGANMSGEAVLDQVLGQARELLQAASAEVVLFDRTTGRPALRQRVTDTQTHGHVTALDPDDETLGWTGLVRDGHAVYVPRTERSSERAGLRDRLGVQDLILAPLRVDDTVIGAILVTDRLGSVTTFDDGDCRLFETLANHASVAFENSRLLQQLRKEAEERRHEALHDSLTGLPNRTLFSQEVDEATARPGGSAVMLMDLDRFKEVNDTLGHHNGDVLLCQVTARLLDALGDVGSAARLGGDEFAVLLPRVADAAAAEAVAERVLDALLQPFVIDELSLGVGASIGVALAPEHGTDAATLLQRADVAMYEAKASHGGMVLYSADRDTYSPKRLQLAGELRQAIDDGDIVVYFQPKALLSTREVIGAEALVRWRHPTLGFLPPDEFIPVAEQTDLISHLTTYVLRAAIQQCAEWQRMGHDIGVAVNLAVRSLLDNTLPDTVRGLLAASDVPAGSLTLEITESSIMADPGRTIAVLESLAEAGVRLSVDDFGTGYSSLTYLQRLPVHEVKVDKSFVFHVATDAADAMIVQSIVELGHNLGLTVVAEGVEDQISWDRLHAMACDVAQGYYLSKPVPAASMTEWLDGCRAAQAAEATTTPIGAARPGAGRGRQAA